MRATAESPRPNVLPLIRYRDLARSIEWLCRALGFEKHHVALRDDGSIAYAHLRFGGSLIMVTPTGDAGAVPAIEGLSAEGNTLITLPAEVERGETQSCYFVVDDIEAHCRKAKEAGAEIVLEIKIYKHGGCRYACRDPEGHVWTFGTYDPWREQAQSQPHALPAFMRSAASRGSGLAAMADWRAAVPATIGMLAVLAGCGVALWLAQSRPDDGAVSVEAAQAVAAKQAEAKLTEERYAREASERALKEARERLTREKESREAAEHAASALRDQLAQQPPAAESEKVAEERAARFAAEEAARIAQEDLARARAENAARSEQPTEVVAHAPPANEPRTDIGESVVITQPAEEAAAKEPTPESAGEADDEAASPLLAKGRTLLAKGDLEGARRAFLRAADDGLAEAALALGSTYDPASLARAGLKKGSGDPERAKLWYRRAHELTQAAALKSKAVNHE